MKTTWLKRLTALTLIAALLFSMLLIPANAAEAVRIKSDSYVFVSALRNDLVLDVYGNGTDSKTNVQVYSKNSSKAQIFQPVHVKKDWYKIVHVHSGRVIDVSGGSSASGTNVWLYDWNESDAQLWKFIPNGNGGYYIKSKLGTYLDVYGGGTSDGTNVWTYQGNESPAQSWYLKPVCSAPSVTYLEVVVNNAPVRASNTNKGKILTRCPAGTILESTGSNYNYKLNKWYKVQYEGETRYIYSENVTVKEHDYEKLEFDNVTYHICDCGHVTVSAEEETKLYSANTMALYASYYGSQYLPTAAGVAASDAVLPVGDAIALLILAYGAYSLATNSQISSTTAQSIAVEFDFDDYLKDHATVCSDASFRMVQRHPGSNLTYIGKQCYNAAQAYILARFAADVYTTYQPNAFLAASMHKGGCYSEIDKNKPDYYYHYHLGANAKQKVGGHIFYGATPSGMTPS